MRTSFLEKTLEDIKPWFWFPPEYAHAWLSLLLESLCFMDESLFSIDPEWSHWREFRWNNILFRNPVGLAGGVDKNAESLIPWWKLGVGFIEVGTVTPHAQTPNPGVIIARNIKDQSLWNKMGFPNRGSKELAFELEKISIERPTPLFVNIGKNRWTQNPMAHEDYIYLLERIHSFADAFVLNISSPNTQGLRELFRKENLVPFLDKIISRSKKFRKPILLKLSPDESESSLKFVLDTSRSLGIDGYIVSNTTTHRPENSLFPKDGGLSGKPLSPFSINTLKYLVDFLGNNAEKKLIINAGGVFNLEDVNERLNLGAHLVQLYSGIVFNGPYIFKKIAREHFIKYSHTNEKATS